MITDIDHTPEFLAELKKACAKEIHAGILGKENSDIVKIATINEWGARIDYNAHPKVLKWFYANMRDQGIQALPKGTPKGYFIIPERAAIRKAFDNNDNISSVFKFGQEAFNNTGDIVKAIHAMGSKMVSKIQESYRSNIAPSNHPLTVAMKGGKDKTLVASGKLQQAVSYELK